MNNKCLIGKGATTVVSQLRWFQNLKDVYETVKLHMLINKKQWRRTDTLCETLRDGQIIFHDRGFSGLLRSKSSMQYLHMMDLYYVSQSVELLTP